jgi:cobalt-zinc-cadmium efflux system outer membrane protein
LTTDRLAPVVRPFVRTTEEVMPNRSRVCVWLAVATLVGPAGADAQERTAPDLVESIVRSGPHADAIRSGVEVVRRDQESRLAFPNPGLTYSREGAGYAEFIQIAQPLPVFGVRRALARAGVAAIAAAEAERDARLWDLRIQATRAVARWAWARARLGAAASDVEVVARLVDVLRAREQEGEGSRFDRLRVEHELAELRHSAVVAAVDDVDARAAVLALLPPGQSVTGVTVPNAAASSTPIDVEVLWERARVARGELRALQSARARAAVEVDAARRARWPAPVVEFGIKRADNGARRERGSVFGLTVAAPVFDTGTREAARWTAEGARLAAERSAIEREIRVDIERAVDVLNRRRQAAAGTSADATASDLVAIAQLAYREGEIEIVTLIDAVRAASRARLRDLERRLDLQLAELALERAVGERLWP